MRPRNVALPVLLLGPLTVASFAPVPAAALAGRTGGASHQLGSATYSAPESQSGPLSPGAVLAVPTARCCMGMAWDDNAGNIVLFGGIDNVGPTGTLKNDTWIWDGSSWQQLFPPAPLPCPRHSTRMYYDPIIMRVVLFGGSSDATVCDSTGHANTQEDTWLWDGVGKTWTRWCPTCTTPTARESEGLAYDPVGHKILLFGGDGAPDPETAVPQATLATTWLWDGNGGGSWTKCISNSCTGNNAPCPRATPTEAWDPQRSKILLFGGHGNTPGCMGAQGDTWTWDGSISKWAKCSVGSCGAMDPRYGHRMEWDSHVNRIVMFGGLVSSVLKNDTWEIDGGAWAICDPTHLGCTNTLLPQPRC